MFCKATKQLCKDLGMDYNQVRIHRHESEGRFNYMASGYDKYSLVFGVILDTVEHPMLATYIEIGYSEGSMPFDFGEEFSESERDGGYLIRWVEYAVHKFRLEHEPANLTSLFSGASIRVYGIREDTDLTLAEMKIFVNGLKKTPNDQVTVYKFRHIEHDTRYMSFSYGFSVAMSGIMRPFWVFFHGVGGTHPSRGNRHLELIEAITKNIKGSTQTRFDVEYHMLNKYLSEHAVSFELRHNDELSSDLSEAVLNNLYAEVEKHALDLFNQNQYSNSVAECCKAFEQYIRKRFKSNKHGQYLMSYAFALNKGIHLVQGEETETEGNVREGLMYLCMGLMRHTRNPLAHEPQLNLPMDKQSALELLGFISYLFKQTDNLLENEKYALTSEQ